MIHFFVSEQDEGDPEQIQVSERTKELVHMPDSSVLWQRRLSEQPSRQHRPRSAPLLHTLRHLALNFRFVNPLFCPSNFGGGACHVPTFHPNTQRLWRHSCASRDQVDEEGGVPDGVPLGGMGGGCVGRSWCGNFHPGLLLPNQLAAPVVPANQFSLFVQPSAVSAPANTDASVAVVLNPGMPPEGRYVCLSALLVR